jgi:hypothetical protein
MKNERGGKNEEGRRGKRRRLSGISCVLNP